ncbi:MAG: hypothetical protein IKL51_04275 [Lachnospiraceae bacterium]|nr:hypothetical protein [Lachnospiraceae bacterium]
MREKATPIWLKATLNMGAACNRKLKTELVTIQPMTNHLLIGHGRKGKCY